MKTCKSFKNYIEQDLKISKEILENLYEII